MPIVWRLGSDEQPELRLQMRVRGGAVELHIAGLNCEPPSGAEALYEMASEAWAEAGVDPATALESISGMNRLSDVMWGLWKRRKDELAGTKVWKIVESLLGSAAVRAAAPMHDLCGLIIGTSFVARYRITCLRFSVLIGCRNKVRDTAVSAPRLAEGSASSVSDPPSPSGAELAKLSAHSRGERGCGCAACSPPTCSWAARRRQLASLSQRASAAPAGPSAHTSPPCPPASLLAHTGHASAQQSRTARTAMASETLSKRSVVAWCANHRR